MEEEQQKRQAPPAAKAPPPVAAKPKPAPAPVEEPDEPGAEEEEDNSPTGIARGQGWNAFQAGQSRKPPREYTAANRFDELEAWYEGFDEAVEDEERQANIEADRDAGRTFS
jgi:hypothetical protein